MNETLRSMRSRKSAREFTNDLISKEELDSLLESIRFTPSGKNAQPWKLTLVQGGTLEKLRSELCEKFDNGEESHADFDFTVLPAYRPRAIALGKALFVHKGIARLDKEARRLHDRANFELFSAPQVFILSCLPERADTTLMDLGIFAGYLMLGLESLGYKCCPQVSTAGYPDAIRKAIPSLEGQSIAMVFPFGKPQEGSHVNAFEAGREPVENWFEFLK